MAAKAYVQSMVHPLRVLLVAAGVGGIERLCLCGPYFDTAEEFRAYLLDVPAVWTAEISHARENGRCEARYIHRDGHRVRVVSAAAWFGKTAHTVPEIRTLFARLRHGVGVQFRLSETDRAPLVTPAVLGMWLWRQEAEAAAPPLTDDEQDTIRATAGQGREELLVCSDLATIPRFEYWDLKLAYPSMMENLPVGPVLWTRGVDVDLPSLKGRLQARVTVPRDWAHVGLVPWKERGTGLRYPHEPGEEFVTWCDPSEARMALAHGWKVEAIEAMRMAEGRPLDLWSRRLKRLWLYYDQAGERELRDSVRAVLIQTLGDFQGRGRSIEKVFHARGEEHVTAMKEAPRIERPSHPEWPACVWARCRYRVTKHLLMLPRRACLGAYVDQIYSTEPLFLGPGRAEPGQFRRKGLIDRELPAPRSLTALHQLAAVAEEAS
jgi:hypothetical protein